MIVVLHVLIALASIGYTTYLLFAPAKQKFNVAYCLVGATLASGTYLVISTHQPLLQSCVTGLIYLAVTTTGIVAAHYRLVRQEIKHKIDQ